MNSPYCGKFYVSQQYKPGTHDGLDLVGQDSKEIHATISGVIQYAGWENASNPKQGFGQYVCIKGTDGLYYYFGHLSEIKVKTGQIVKITDVIGVEGSTGYSTGSHCHYEIRGSFYKGAKVYDVVSMSGIPNALGTYDDGYRPVGATAQQTTTKIYSMSNAEDVKAMQKALNNKGFNCGNVDGILGYNTKLAMFKYCCDSLLK